MERFDGLDAGDHQTIATEVWACVLHCGDGIQPGAGAPSGPVRQWRRLGPIAVEAPSDLGIDRSNWLRNCERKGNWKFIVGGEAYCWQTFSSRCSIAPPLKFLLA